MTNINVTLDEMRKRNPPRTVEAMILADQTVTEADMERIQAEQSKNYMNRERIPEAYLEYIDLYVRLCGKDQDGNWNQVPTQRVFSDWLQTAEEWKQEHLKPEHITAAFIKANSEQGFPVGRPGALTVTAVAMKTKATANIAPTINVEAINYTKKLIEEKFGSEMKFVPKPVNLPRPTFKGPTHERANR
jgi:hypothetical protein